MEKGTRAPKSKVSVSAPTASLSPTTASTRLEPPKLHRATVPRPDLIQRLVGSDAPVVSVSAPPGYGKTTVLAQWEAAETRPFAWISLDPADDDPSVLLSDVVAALGRHGAPGGGSPHGNRARAIPGHAPRPSLRGVVGSMGDLGPCVVVFDDVHRLERSESLDVISTLIASTGGGSTIVLSGRGQPLIPMARMHGQGLVMPLGAEDLALGPDETRDLLHRQGVDLPSHNVEIIHQRTEGWPVAVYLTALSLKAGGRSESLDPRRMDSLMTDYQRLELLDRLPGSEVRFLTRTALLDRLCGPLCDAVLGTTDSAAILETLERTNMLVVPLDGHHHWYRYHHLFRQLLRSDLEQREPAKAPVLLRRAAEWSEENGDPEAAIRYAQAAGDDERVARLVSSQAQPFFASGRADTVEMWFEWLLEHSTIERYGAAAPLGVWLQAMRGHPAEAERWAEIIDEAAVEGAAMDGSESLEPWRAMVAAMLCRDGAEQMRRDADTGLRLLAPTSPYRPQALVLVALSRLLAGDTEAAEETLIEAVELGESTGAANATVLALSERAVIAQDRGDFDIASDLAHRAAVVRDQTGLAGYSTSGLSFAIGARIALHAGEPELSKVALTAAHRLRPVLTYAIPHITVQTLLEMVRVNIASADGGGARTLLREIDLVLSHRPDLGVLVAQRDVLRTQVEAIRATAPGVSTLTTAELRLLPFLPTHLTFREIAQRLDVSPHTIKTQAIAVYRKLDVNSRSDAVSRAFESGLLEP